MKKKVFGGIMLLVAAMIFSVGGTCFAQSGTVYVDQSGTTRLTYGPVFSTADNDRRPGIGSGATAYGMIGDPWDDVGAKNIAGATPFAIARTITDGLGNMNLVWMPDQYAPDFSGATPIGSPAVISGKTSAVVVVVQAPDAAQVANFDRANNAYTGVTVMMIDGATMTANWTRGIPEQPVATTPLQAWDKANPYYPTELTIWKPRKGSRLDDTGVTIYGTSTADPAGTSGASVWSLTNWGAPAGGGTWDGGSGMTVWPVPISLYSLPLSNTNNFVGGTGNGTVAPIDGFVTSPVISGNSVFYVGSDYFSGVGGLTVYQLHKDHLDAGVVYAATVKPSGVDFSSRFMPTPVVSGGSLFVVGNQGGVTVYDTQDLAIGGGRTAGYLGNILLPVGATNTGVTASPVTYSTEVDKDPYIIMCGTSAVTAWKVSDGLASVPTQRQWWYDFAANHGAGNVVIGTPAVAARYVFVPVTDTGSGDGRIFAFKITDAPDMPNGQLRFARQFDMNAGAVASPIVVHRELWAFSYGNAAGTSARAYKWNVNDLLTSDSMRAHKYWTQFKFDAEKTGDATVQLEDDWYPEDSSGCFLSTIQ